MNIDQHLDLDTVLEAIEALGDGIAIYDANARPIYANAVTLKRFGRMYADMNAGMSYREALEAVVLRAVPSSSADDVDRLATHFEQKFHNGETYASIADDGSQVLITFRPMSKGLKAAISVDVTELRKREKELEKARKAAETASVSKSAFLANMSHEIRTPLNGVLGMAQVLASTNLNDQQRDYIGTIIESGKTLMALLNDVLDLSKIEAGKFDILCADTNLSHVMRRQLALWKPRAEEKGLELTLAFDADLPAWASIDAVRVQQCVSNLLSNAIKFTASGRVEAIVNAKALPLNGVLGMAQVLASTNLNDQQRDYIGTIIESGKFDILCADTNLSHVMRRQLALWKPRAEEKGLELTLAFDADLPAWASIDAVRVQQCVSNLLSNAIKFTASGRVEAIVNAKALPLGAHMIEVIVRDTGSGMDADILGRLFKPFAQADETIQRSHGGSGLGLSITRRLAELMGGTASATSEPGRGSTFRFSFRANPAKPRQVATSAASSGPSNIRDMLKQSNLRVLLVDDHPINRQVAALFLRPFNMRIVEAVNGAEALAALERETFDIVLLDMHMPVMDGPTTIAKIRASGEAWATMPVIALTADAMSGDRERYLALGMDGYLSKPLAERELLSEIARVRTRGVDAELAARAS